MSDEELRAAEKRFAAYGRSGDLNLRDYGDYLRLQRELEAEYRARNSRREEAEAPALI